ncbi:hypothetical protein SAMN04487785_10275 [Dyella jiangningensis]|uniref:MMPL family transporter n=2 Tax=Gammaproteobacteria TaxID=1236 RepID=UPI000885F2D4|nr:MMPL family transporter [Dyella sp. AtDHG13]PXV60354.1 hypothetical protein BDW41_10275 [Dyella sp. AtDHG13]SDJ42023.1 hypothetical protein SAMN04487785_10275 [Dyella jiangningensis]
MFKAIHKGLVSAVDRSGRHHYAVLLIAAVFVVLSLWGASKHLSIDTDSDHLFSDKLPWRQQSLAFARQFPQFSDTLTAVVRAPTAEEARIAAQALNAKLAADKEHFRSSSTPGISPFFNREGLLLLPQDELESTLDSMLQAQPLLGPLAKDPSARGLFNGIDLMVEGVRRGMANDLSSYDAALGNVAHTMEDAVAGKNAPLSWQALLTPDLVNSNGGQEFILIHPVLDHTALEPGQAATQAMLRLANELPEVKSGRVRVNYTGSVPLADEEFASLTDRAGPIAIGSSLLLVFWLVLALGTWRLIVPVIITLVVGLIYTLGFAALAVGRLNLVSVAFAVLFVGLAVDFGIQFGVRLHARQYSDRTFDDSLHETAHRVVSQVGLAALATACGFLAFAPTDFTGVAELGIIAGVGMLLALICTLTVLPALLRLLSKGSPHAEVALPGGAKADGWLNRHRKAVLVAFGVLGIAGIWCAATIPFDANPLHTKRADSEAMRTLTSLMDDPNTNPFTMDLLAKDLPAAKVMSEKLGKLPEVAQVVSGVDFVPAGQDDKLEQLQQASDLMYAVLNPGEKVAAPTADDIRSAARDTSEGIASVADKLPAQSPLRRIGKALAALSHGTDAQVATANDALTKFLPYTLNQLADSLSATPITMQNLPDDLRRDWFAPDGRVRIQVTPTTKAQSTAGLRDFVGAVQKMAPDAAGSAVDTIKAADTILIAFREAAIYATAAIAIVLILVLRRARDAGLVLATLLMSALLTALLARLFGIAINFANIIALPLLLGVGVSFNVYFVMNWRHGMQLFLGSPTARAILFSALTTGTAFGSLAIARHPGTASMGSVLLLSLVAVLLSTFAFLPAMLYSIGRCKQPISHA